MIPCFPLLCLPGVQAAVPIYWLLPSFVWFMRLLWPRFAMPLFIPTYLFRSLVFKLFRDVSSIPALLELLKLSIKVWEMCPP